MARFDPRDLEPIDGPITVYIDPGHYLARVTVLEEGETNAGQPKVHLTAVVHGGEFDGFKFFDDIITARGVQKNDFGPRKYLGLLLALGVPIGQRVVDIPLEKLVGRFFGTQIEDNVMVATDKYPERVVSRPAWYQPLNANEKELVASITDGVIQTAEPEATQPAAARKPKQVAAAVAVQEVAEVETDDVEDEVDKLFS